MTTKPTIDCPNCDKSSDEAETQDFWPFCSKRCKLIDLGEWASGNYRIPGEKVNPENMDEGEDG